jgi:hypothetical protein
VRPIVLVRCAQRHSLERQGGRHAASHYERSSSLRGHLDKISHANLTRSISAGSSLGSLKLKRPYSTPKNSHGELKLSSPSAISAYERPPRRLDAYTAVFREYAPAVQGWNLKPTSALKHGLRSTSARAEASSRTGARTADHIQEIWSEIGAHDCRGWARMAWGRLPPKSWPEPRIRNAAAHTRIVSGGRLWQARRELSCYFKYMACGRIPEFESHHPSHAVRLFCSDDGRLSRCGPRVFYGGLGSVRGVVLGSEMGVGVRCDLTVWFACNRPYVSIEPLNI